LKTPNKVDNGTSLVECTFGLWAKATHSILSWPVGFQEFYKNKTEALLWEVIVYLPLFYKLPQVFNFFEQINI